MITERLPCAECGYQNEPERVYCHNCGAKLDRALFVAQSAKKAAKQKKLAGKAPVSTLNKPPRRPFLRPLMTSLGVAALLAAGLLMYLPPSNAPGYDADPLLELPEVGGALDALAGLDRRVTAAFTERQVNAYIKATVRSKSKGPLSDHLQYLGSAVDIEDETAQVFLTQSIFGHPVHVHMTFRPSGEPGDIQPAVVSCGIGRLDLPPAAAPLVHLILNKLWKAASRDLDAMNQLGEINLTQDKVVFASKGT